MIRKTICINQFRSKHNLLLVSIQYKRWEQRGSDILSGEEPFSDEMSHLCAVAKTEGWERSASLGILLFGGQLTEQLLYCQITWGEISLFLKF